MKLYSLRIEGFRRHIDTEVIFSDATFLIGENNIGKSSILAALDYLLNDKKRIPNEEFYHVISEDQSKNIRLIDKIVLTAEFRNVPECAKTWKGFKGRILPYVVPEGSAESGNRIIYKKTFVPETDYIVEMKEYRRIKKLEFQSCKNLSDYLNNGLSEDLIPEALKNIEPTKSLTAKQREIIEELEELYNFDNSQETWFKNPGGIPGNVLLRLPRFLLIPAQDKLDELSGASGTLLQTLSELFNEVRDSSENFRKAQEYLNLLAAELDPSDGNSEFGKMMSELNNIMSDVFPNTGMCAETSLNDANKVIKPQFKVTMFSNITTPVTLQGTGLIRSAVFALLRYKNIRDNRKGQCSPDSIKTLLIGFEEPEIYLHPNAAFKLRDTIYGLAESEQNQIVCTTHSPYMIDLSKKTGQVLNNLCISIDELKHNECTYHVDKINAIPFNISNAFMSLQQEDKQYVKMVLKIDDSIAKVFFVNNVLVIEGDTEEIVLKETISRMQHDVKNDILSNWQIVKARGKASIISFVKYLKAMGINPVVIHDEDSDKERAKVFNKYIYEVVDDPSKVYLLHNCIEEVLGYNPPTEDKPYKAYEYIQKSWGDSWDSITEPWKKIVEKIFEKSFNLSKVL